MESWRKYLNEVKESSKAATIVGDMFGSVRYDGSSYPKGFESILDEDEDEEGSSDFKDIISKIRPPIISQVIKKHSRGMLETSIDMSLIKDPVEIAILNSIFLFTTGNVATVRNPEKFDPKLANKGVESPALGGFRQGGSLPTYVSPKKTGGSEVFSYDDTTRGGIDRWGDPAKGWGIYRYFLKPTKELYTIANRVIRVMASMRNPSGSTTIYRGIGLPYEVFSNLKQGDEFYPGGRPMAISSWTTNEEVAHKYDCGGVSAAQGAGKWDMMLANYDKKWVCTTLVAESKRGIYMGDLSGWRGENEFLLSAPVRIKKIVLEKDISAGIDKPKGTRFEAKIYCLVSAGYQTEIFFEEQK